jgi:hypothetical protein
MSNYEYSSYSSSSTSANGAGATTGFDPIRAVFSQVDANGDGTIDRNEFQQWASAAGQFSGNAARADQQDAGVLGVENNFESATFGSAEGVSGSFNVESGLASAAGMSSFESSSVSIDGLAAGNAFQQTSSFDSQTGDTGSDAQAFNQAANYTAETNAAWSKYGAEVRGAGLFVDNNPQIIRRQAPGGVQTYTQNIKVRFLQPPPIPAAGVSDRQCCSFDVDDKIVLF